MGAANLEQDMLDIKKSLQDAQKKGSTSQILSLLKQLSKFTITAALLRKTEMGLFVNKMKTHADADVSRLAKTIVKDWRAQVAKETPASTSTISTASSTTVKSEVSKSGSTVVSSSVTTTTSTSSSSTRPTVDTKPSLSQIQTSRDGSSTTSSPRTPTDILKDRTVRSDGMRIKSTGNDVRDKCIEMLYQALGTSSYAESDRLLQKATKLEELVFKKLSPDGSPSKAYRERIRLFFMNLRKNNPELREAVVSGEVPVDDFCDYTSADMATAESKARDRAIQLDNMFRAKGAEEQQAETDMFKCGKCKGRKCRYYQMQTRSADEPMTTFVTCINCGNRWKFS
ncbi:RNA polymerase II elongation factor [Modicella reniformis]|uniref:Transcription elongation factor n=1 Tax=Modicella reniformis TaxID=1440133 RepID=A0A9P6LTS8_9FUNG|nr:RNA polymerase II elongation factor [Modicella reniformis]